MMNQDLVNKKSQEEDEHMKLTDGILVMIAQVITGAGFSLQAQKQKKMSALQSSSSLLDDFWRMPYL